MKFGKNVNLPKIKKKKEKKKALVFICINYIIVLFKHFKILFDY